MKPNRLWVLTIASVWYGVASAQEVLTLEGAIQQALQNNGQARALFEERVVSRARLESARASLFPSFDIATSSTRTRLEQGGTTTELTQRQTALNVEWLLLDNGVRNLRIRQASRSNEGVFYSTQDNLRTLILQTARAYFEVLRRQELLQVADETVRRAETILQAVRAQAEVGTAPAKDVLQAEADLANARVQQIQARNALRLAETDLKRLLGWSAEKPLPALQKVENPATAPVSETLQALWEQARRQRPDLRATELSAQSARLALEIARMNSLVQLRLSVSGFREFDPDTRTQGQIQILASYPLFDGGLLRANLREAEASYRGALFRLTQAERDAYAEVESAYLSVQETRERLSAAQLALAAAQRNYEAARDAFQEGAGTLIEVLTAQLALTTAQTNFVQAVYDSALADLQLRYATGARLPAEP
ncbi:MAG: TolC family protein [Armatimonadetes bacterium]|nr:TolC family protein [Armatimonadota bacterium]CUU37441.1 type I secretion outer membrane protein, TolC family [Armatimonadetes bacterium DC]